MKIISYMLFINFIFLLSSCSLKHIKPVRLSNTEVKFIKSVSNQIDYKLFISLPEGYDDSSEKYPVLYLLDPDNSFAMAHDIARNLSVFSNLNKVIIVGIGYKEQTKLSFAKNRARDYVPFSIINGVSKFEGGGGGDYVGLSKNTGHAHKFREFLANELFSYINSNYRTNNERALYGHSQGGLFAAWVMITHPETFNGYIILSPSLWVENGQLLEQTKTLSKTILAKSYMAVGEQEEFTDYPMISDLKKFHEYLPKNIDFKSKLEILSGENHASIIASGLTNGLRYLFSKP